MTLPVPESQQQYGSILTLLGENAEQNGKLLNKQLEITHMAIGDANDQYVQPDRKQTALVNELARIEVNSVDVLQPTPESVPMLKVEAILPDEVNDIVIREFAAVATFNGQTYFHAIGNCARVYVPPPVNNGNVRTPVTLEMIFVITSAEPIVEIDPHVVTASREYVHKQINHSDERLAQTVIDQNSKDWFIKDGFLVTPQLGSLKVHAGGGYVSGNHIRMEHDGFIEMQEKPAFIYIDAWREGTQLGAQEIKINFIVTADELDDYRDETTTPASPHFVSKIAQVMTDSTVRDLRKKGEGREATDLVIGLRDLGSYQPHPVTLKKLGDYVTDERGIRWVAKNPLGYTTNPSKYLDPSDDNQLTAKPTALKQDTSFYNKLSNWINDGDDASDIIPLIWEMVDRIEQDVNFTLTKNIRHSGNSKKIFNTNDSKIYLSGDDFDIRYAAIELTGHHTETRDLYFWGPAIVTPLRQGNTSYGKYDQTRRVGVKVIRPTFDGTGFKGPNHGNLVVIGAIEPKIRKPKFIGVSKAGGNCEILGVKGGACKEGYAENGLLVNFHATSADGAGYPSEDFKFIDCVGIHHLSSLGAKGGNNNLKISRDCKRIKVVRGRYASIGNGDFKGNDHVLFIQGASGNKAIDVDIEMTNNGDFKSAYGIYDHGESLTGSNDNSISGGNVTINSPGVNNRIVNIRSDRQQEIKRNKIRDINYHVYNGEADYFCEIVSTTPDKVDFNRLIDNVGRGVGKILRHRGKNLGNTLLSGNVNGNLVDTAETDSGYAVSILEQSAPNYREYTFAESGNVIIGLSGVSRRQIVISLQKNETGGNVSIAGFSDELSQSPDGYMVTLIAKHDINAANTVELLHDVGGLRLKGKAPLEIQPFDSVVLTKVGGDWVQV